MTIVAAFLYRDGLRAEPVAIDAPPPAMTGSDFVWIGVADPTAEEMRQLQAHYDLHPLAVEDALNGKQLPKIEVYGPQLFVVTRTAHLEGDMLSYGETAIFVGPNHIISVRHGSARAHIQLRAQMEAAPSLLRHGVDYVLHGIIDFIVDGYLPIVETIEEHVLEMEQRAVESFLSREEVTRIFHLRRELIRFRRTLGPMSEVAGKLVHLDLPCLDKEIRPYFRDVMDHVRRVETMVEHLREVLTSVFEVGQMLESQRQGAITRQLAAWAAILAVPTAIAGIYGMNFDYMPELRMHDAYFVVLAVIALLCVTLYWRFRRMGWL
ncbi:MAG: magnesium and cobalt transport protein CorA [Sphingobium sp.]